MKSILLYASDDESCEGRVDTAIAIATAFQSHVTCLQVTPFESFILGDPLGGIYALVEVVEEIRTREEEHRLRIEAQIKRAGVSWDWLHFDGNATQIITELSGLVDLVVLNSGDDRSTHDPFLAGTVSNRTRSMVLAVPKEITGFDPFGTAVIAWDNSQESAHAVRQAIPLIARAKDVHVVEVASNGEQLPRMEASEYLARHGIESELHKWPQQERNISDALLDAAGALRASYIVVGAYGRSRAREALFGGVTRELLEHSSMPLLMAH